MDITHQSGTSLVAPRVDQPPSRVVLEGNRQPQQVSPQLVDPKLDKQLVFEDDAAMKHKIRFAHLLLALAIIFVLSASADSQQTVSPSHVRAQHAAVIEKWLESSPSRANLRVAIDKDCRNKSGLAYQRKDDRSYQPYYAVGDFNHDGREDFAVAFVNDRKQRSKFSFAIFNGPFGAKPVPAYMEENVDLGTSTFFWKNDGRRDSYLLQGAFESDDCVIYRPRGKTYAPKPCLD